MIQDDYDIIGFPRLVRLNPSVPWKTRGNGAVAFQIGTGTGKRVQIGMYGSHPLFGFTKMSRRCTDKDIHTVSKIVEQCISTYAQLEDENTNPGVVIGNNDFDEHLYWDAVQGIVKIETVVEYLGNKDIFFRQYKKGRGVIGASAAVAWPQTQGDHTFELISYRQKHRWGLPREVSDKSVQRIDLECPKTFDNYDYRNHHNRIVPNSPCPVLYGVRGDTVSEVVKAVSVVDAEPYHGWIIFVSNQGTDDHLINATIRKITAFSSVILRGRVYKNPWTIVGGHTFFGLEDPTGKITCAAYEPTKEFRTIIRRLHTGDKIKVFGSIREKTFTVNLEKVYIEELVEITRKTENPECPTCGKHMKSMGTKQGFKCRKCGETATEGKYAPVDRGINPGWYEVAVCARRHLSKPLKRIKK